MQLTKVQCEELKRLMKISAHKGNLANAGVVLENGETLAYAESWVVSNHDATAHSERMLVQSVCKIKKANYTPGLTMISVVEPCIMCMSACSQAGYKEIGYIIPASKYVEKIPWMTDSTKTDKHKLAADFSEPIALVYLEEYFEEFSQTFEDAMKDLLK